MFAVQTWRTIPASAGVRPVYIGLCVVLASLMLAAEFKIQLKLEIQLSTTRLNY